MVVFLVLLFAVAAVAAIIVSISALFVVGDVATALNSLEVKVGEVLSAVERVETQLKESPPPAPGVPR